MLRLLALMFAAGAALPLATQRNDVFAQVRASTDVVWLEKLASEAGAAEAVTPAHFTSKTLRAAAYIRLGELASDASIAAAKRVEAAAREWSLLPRTVSLSSMTHPLSHFGDLEAEPFVQVRAADGVTYALIGLTRLGGADVFLMTRRPRAAPATWSRPLLLPDQALFGIAEPRLKFNSAGDHLIFEFRAPESLDAGAHVSLRPYRRKPNPPAGLQTWTIVPAVIRRDRDGDGWTDLEEQRLGTSPTVVDSDGDGIPDGRDTAPRYAPTALENDDEEVRVLQKVFFAGFGIHGSADLLFVADGSRRFQPWGTRGPVLFGLDHSEWSDRFGYGPPILRWKLPRFDTDSEGIETATVEFGDSLAGSIATLKRYRGEWFVTKIVMNWIS